MVDQFDLKPFLRVYRADEHGYPAYHSKTLLGVLLYAYCIGVRSSRQVERRLTRTSPGGTGAYRTARGEMKNTPDQALALTLYLIR